MLQANMESVSFKENKSSTLLAILASLVIYLAIYLLGFNQINLPTRGNLILDQYLLNLHLITDVLIFLSSNILILSVLIFVSIYSSGTIKSLIYSKFGKRISLLTLSIPISLLICLVILNYCFTHFPNLQISIELGSYDPSNKYRLLTDFNLYGLTFLFLMVGLSYIFLIKQKNSKDIGMFTLYLLCIGILLTPAFETKNKVEISSSSTLQKNDKPNIILIGLDSISYLQAKDYGKEIMPNLHKFLQGSQVYSNAYSPIARTFPAWNSILSGTYPNKHKARFNLTNFKDIDKSNMLQNILKKQGYRTIYAQDERRFNNIDEDYGFDLTVGPRIGASDFIIPIFANNPFIAYFASSVTGEYLFPSISINRVSAITYQPNLFTQRLLSSIANIKDEDTPLLLTTHLCTAHYPYTWAEFDLLQTIQDEEKLHQLSAKRLDEQFGNLINGLDSLGVLENALVVVLSDHGEALGNSTPLWVNTPYEDLPEKAKALIGFKRGHGNSLVSKHQNSVIIALQDKNNESFTRKVINKPVSLVDITPSILSYLGLPYETTKYSGVDLLNNEQTKQRNLFMETGLLFKLPKPNETIDEMSEELNHHFNNYKIDKSGRLFINNHFYVKAMKDKRYGLLNGKWLLIKGRSLVDSSSQNLLIDRTTGNWQLNASAKDVKALTGSDLLRDLDEYISTL